VVDALAAALPFARVELVGYSMGARLALALATRHPQRVAALTLIGVDPGLRQEVDRAPRVAWEDGLAEELLRLPLDSFVARWEALPIFASQRRLPAEILATQRHQRLQHVPAALAWALRVLGTGRMPELWSALPALELPIRLLTGALDEKFSAIARELATLLPNLEHRCVPDAGHNLILEAPAVVRSALRDPLHPRV
jgi:2-succinyl-6-hydroxy-2,4-cyclohexadiene-1-carboxylate synthase